MPKESLFFKKTSNFIETGSERGDGIMLALNSGFDKVYSIELSDSFYNQCVERFKSEPRVELIKGDSYYELENLLSKTQEPFTYWLDGHYSGPHTALGVLEFPIMQELESILKRNVDGELIYIDDMSYIRNYSEDINEEKIKELVSKYKKDAKIYYEDTSHGQKYILVIEY
jgi:hypothetical protein